MILSEQLSKKIVNIMSDNNIIDSHLDAAYIYCIDFALDLVSVSYTHLTLPTKRIV